MEQSTAKKYEFLINDTIELGGGVTLFRIKALIGFGNVKKGELGGYVEKEGNLCHSGKAWVTGNAKVYGNASLHDSAWLCDNAKVYDNANVLHGAKVTGNAEVSGDAWIFGDTKISAGELLYDNARVSGRQPK